MTLVNIAELEFYPGNARRGDVGMIADSLKKHGQYKPIVANRGTHAPALERTILAGNHTWQAALQLGWETIDVHWVDVDEHKARDIVLIDNRANDVATYDVDGLVDLLTEYPDLDGTGFGREDLDELLDSLESRDEEPPALPPDPPEDQWNILVECADKDEAKLLKAKLTAEGYTCGLA